VNPARTSALAVLLLRISVNAAEAVQATLTKRTVPEKPITVEAVFTYKA
jgi:hypothetical protein